MPNIDVPHGAQRALMVALPIVACVLSTVVPNQNECVARHQQQAANFCLFYCRYDNMSKQMNPVISLIHREAVRTSTL